MAEDERQERCENCRFYVKGECRIEPPAVIFPSPNPKPEYWCGKWEPPKKMQTSLEVEKRMLEIKNRKLRDKIDADYLAHKEYARCPNCGRVVECTNAGTPCYAGTCKCGYDITESEFETVDLFEEYMMFQECFEQMTTVRYNVHDGMTECLCCGRKAQVEPFHEPDCKLYALIYEPRKKRGESDVWMDRSIEERKEETDSGETHNRCDGG